MITLSGIRSGILDIPSHAIGPGITSVIGPNGSGKTTLLKLCAGITLPETGTIRIDGTPPREIETGWVNEFPDQNILFERVADEVVSPLRFGRVPCPEIEERLHAQLAGMSIDHLGHRSMRHLSGGEKILVALAAALIRRPRVLVLDECDSHLDGNRAREIDRIVQRSGAPYIIRCTQQMEAAARSDTVIFLEQGRILHAGPPQEVFSHLSDTPFYPLSLRCGR